MADSVTKVDLTGDDLFQMPESETGERYELLIRAAFTFIQDTIRRSSEMRTKPWTAGRFFQALLLL